MLVIEQIRYLYFMTWKLWNCQTFWKSTSFMHNIYSYKKPIEFVDFWPLKSTYNYLLRPHTRFYTPLVKSVRLSHMPQFQFAQIFNNFPDNFKLIMERTDFINHLEEFYPDRYKSSTCNKTLCKFCAFIRWKRERRVCSEKTSSEYHTKY